MRSLMFVSLVVLCGACSMPPMIPKSWEMITSAMPLLGRLSSPTGRADVYATSSSAIATKAEAKLARGEQVGAMLLPEHSMQLSNMVILNGVSRTRLKVINGAESFDADRIQRYKEQAGGKFDIAAEDRVKFDGVDYIIVYSHFSEATGDSHENRIEMKFWDVATGQLVATCEARGVYGSPSKYDGMDEAIATALQNAKLPGIPLAPSTAVQAASASQ